MLAAAPNALLTTAFAPDGRLFVCEQGGRLRVVKNGALLAAPFLTVTVSSAGERGLLGVAFDPSFASPWRRAIPLSRGRLRELISSGLQAPLARPRPGRPAKPVPGPHPAPPHSRLVRRACRLCCGRASRDRAAELVSSWGAGSLPGPSPPIGRPPPRPAVALSYCAASGYAGPGRDLSCDPRLGLRFGSATAGRLPGPGRLALTRRPRGLEADHESHAPLPIRLTGTHAAACPAGLTMVES